MKTGPLVSLVLVALSAASCSRGVEVGSDRLFPSSGGGGGSSLGTVTPPCEVTTCEGKIYACGDCLDNDADERVDLEDPECLSPCDDLENVFGGGVVGPKDGNCESDCAFDGDNGSGNDDCHLSSRCDPLSIAPDFMPSGDSKCEYDPQTIVAGTLLTCSDLLKSQSEHCQEVCLPLTPVGCDCFGCCNLPLGSDAWVWIDSRANDAYTCDTASLGDAHLCRRCTPAPSCLH